MILSPKRQKRYKCKCCGYYTLVGSYEDTLWDICPVCFWENDISEDDENQYSGANRMTLGEARRNYENFGACEKRFVKNVREPKDCEISEKEV